MKKKQRKSCLSPALRIEIRSLLAETVAEALVEARKPWVDPRQQELEQHMRELMRTRRAKCAAAAKLEQDQCPHLQGSNRISDKVGTETSIVWHYFDDQQLRGICTNCQRWFLPTDPDYTFWKSKKTGNKPSASGLRGGPFDGPVLANGLEDSEGRSKQFTDLDGEPSWNVNDASDDPNDWSDEKLEQELAAAKKEYKLQRR